MARSRTTRSACVHGSTLVLHHGSIPGRGWPVQTQLPSSRSCAGLDVVFVAREPRACLHVLRGTVAGCKCCWTAVQLSGPPVRVYSQGPCMRLSSFWLLWLHLAG